MLQTVDDVLVGDAPEIVALAAGDDSGGDFVALGGGHNEDGVLRRFLQRFEQRIERRATEHVDLVNDVDLVLAGAGSEIDLVTQVTDVVDAVVGGGVDFDHIQVAAFGDGNAVGADLIWLAVGWVQAVEGLRQDTSRRSLAGAAWAGKQVGVGCLALSDGALQRVGDVILPYEITERPGAPLAVENLRGGSHD